MRDSCLSIFFNDLAFRYLYVYEINTWQMFRMWRWQQKRVESLSSHKLLLLLLLSWRPSFVLESVANIQVLWTSRSDACSTSHEVEPDERRETLRQSENDHLVKIWTFKSMTIESFNKNKTQLFWKCLSLVLFALLLLVSVMIVLCCKSYSDNPPNH